MSPSARPPGSEQHHYQERTQNGEQDRYELHPLGYLTKKDIQRGHNSPVLSCAGPPKRAISAPNCEALSKRRLASRFRSVKSDRPPALHSSVWIQLRILSRKLLSFR